MPSSLASAATGEWQSAWSAASNARSASTQACGRRMVERGEQRAGRRVVGCAPRSRPRPAPGAGSITSSGIATPTSGRPSRSSPAAASSVASASPAASLASRVSTLPRNPTIFRSGRSRSSCARAPRRTGADRRAVRQVGDRRRADDPVAHVGARQHRGDRDRRRADRLDILHRMHRAIDVAAEQRAVEFLGPQRLAADLGERAVLHLVAGGPDHDDLDRDAVRRDQRVAHHARLDERERRAAGAETDAGHHRRS